MLELIALLGVLGVVALFVFVSRRALEREGHRLRGDGSLDSPSKSRQREPGRGP